MPVAPAVSDQNRVNCLFVVDAFMYRSGLDLEELFYSSCMLEYGFLLNGLSL